MTPSISIVFISSTHAAADDHQRDRVDVADAGGNEAAALEALRLDELAYLKELEAEVVSDVPVAGENLCADPGSSTVLTLAGIDEMV